ncbi:MAG: sirohydrochlorin cobaltochelatase [Desulfobacca sp.]|nr:sirohydrochlorin cobaltochelatase [Desulfobacca sp.]
MQIPIVLTAFGTTTNALRTYDFMDKIIKAEFSGHEILWAFSSRMVRDRLKHKKKFEIKHPHEVLQALSEKGHTWAVVQSMHLLCGHEFYRLVEEVKPSNMRTSIGLPLLSSYEDYQQLVRALGFEDAVSQEEALVLVGHGTDHSSWATYPALENILREVYGAGIYVGVIEGCPSQEQVVKAVTRTGVRKVRLLPLMLVAGVHFFEDLCEGEDSWKADFEAAGLEVNVEPQGIGVREEVIRIFIDHIRDALDIIPASDSWATKVLKNRQKEISGTIQVP